MTPARLRQHRLNLGYSVYLMAEILQIDAALLESWENGTAAIPDSDVIDTALESLEKRKQNEACNVVILDGIRK